MTRFKGCLLGGSALLVVLALGVFVLAYHLRSASRDVLAELDEGDLYFCVYRDIPFWDQGEGSLALNASVEGVDVVEGLRLGGPWQGDDEGVELKRVPELGLVAVLINGDLTRPLVLADPGEGMIAPWSSFGRDSIEVDKQEAWEAQALADLSKSIGAEACLATWGGSFGLRCRDRRP